MGCLIDRVGEISNVTFCKCNILWFRLGRNSSQIITHFHFLCCGHTVYERPWKPPGSLREALKFVLFPLHHFVQPILTWIRELIPGFIICSAQITDTNKLERPKNTSSMARLSHEWKVNISLRWKQLLSFGGWSVEWVRRGSPLTGP